MRLDNLSGRIERRLAIAVMVRLEGLESEGAEEHEKTYTDNLSAHGVRVHSTRSWHPGELALVSRLNQEFPARGEVVYCQKLDGQGFFVGLKLEGDMPWAGRLIAETGFLVESSDL